VKCAFLAYVELPSSLPSCSLQCDQFVARTKVFSGGHPAYHQRDLHPQVRTRCIVLAG
jgi:hypothetical protein